jgi:hypothetical protein
VIVTVIRLFPSTMASTSTCREIILLEPDQELRDEFSCPITCDLMLDPVIAGDGHTVSFVLRDFVLP